MFSAKQRRDRSGSGRRRECRSKPIKKLTKSHLLVQRIVRLRNVLQAFAWGSIVLRNSTRGKKFDMFFKRSKLRLAVSLSVRRALIPHWFSMCLMLFMIRKVANLYLHLPHQKSRTSFRAGAVRRISFDSWTQRRLHSGRESRALVPLGPTKSITADCPREAVYVIRTVSCAHK